MSAAFCEFDALDEGKLLSINLNHAVILIAGPDADSFLQRMSTNNLTAFKHSSFLPSSFINNKGKLIDHCLIFKVKKDAFILISSHQQSEVLIAWLEQFHFIEDFSLSDASCDYSCTTIISQKELSDKNIHLFHQFNINNKPTYFYATIAHTALETLPLTFPQFETLRIACLLPQAPSEINDRFMPQNVNLDTFIADDKGCYIGQEVLAKAMTYQKKVKTLCGACVSPDVFEKLALSQTAVFADEHAIITSVAPQYRAHVAQALLITTSPQEADIQLKSPFIKK